MPPSTPPEWSGPRAGPAVGRADWLVRAGCVLFGIGLVAAAAAVIPFFFGVRNLPTWLNAVAGGGLTIGLAVALIGVVAAVRSRIPEEADPELYRTNPHLPLDEPVDRPAPVLPGDPADRAGAASRAALGAAAPIA
ncbi:hypothetical protein [Candidatus Frankia alpina]|uniref:Uncharacterized protein n=1 Tax=Candidatus Frankia alpina TaxID=2699483 RepID=A0A4S5EPY4_9ACTN|nr:hypothetical protein [Candidatus Frankia alpina]THJ74415.1 hypothetical protein E7Y31_11610 [Candidatus Frankia alpina]